MAKAQRIAQEELDALGWAAPDLQGRRDHTPRFWDWKLGPAKAYYL
jgi:hypothetical protein